MMKPILTLLSFLITIVAHGQEPDVLPPTVFAIQNAKIVPGAGKELTQATLVIRDGIITALGKDVKVPPDALKLDGKNLIVYPAFLDGMSNWGFDNALRRTVAGPAASTDLASQALATTRPDNRKGITPEFLVSESLKQDKDKADAWRKAGFSAHVIAPESGFIVGQSAFVSLSNRVPRDAVLRAPFALHMAFTTLGGSEYPRALMGTIAHCRQTFLDAQHYRRLHDAFEKRGRIGKRPPYDPALEALSKIMTKRQPVVFEADSRDQIHRALNFAKEFNLRPILYGGEEAWKVIDRLKKEKVPVLLRLDFPEPSERSKLNPPPERVKKDRDREQQERYRNAGLLQKAGILFAFSTQGQAGDKPANKFRENLRHVIDAGLKPADALRALTTNAARILDMEQQLGTLAVGKAAHLVVMNDEFHKKDAKVKYLFSDGVRFEYEAPEEEKKEDKKNEEKKEEKKEVKEHATELESDRKPKIKTNGNVLIQGARVITITHGVKRDTDILIEKGKITKIGKNLTVPDGVTTINAKDMFVMPGIIDTHCHFSISGGTNEFSLSVVPEVRVRDVVRSDDVSIYRGLAGGLTTARLLHGSANVIGGQDAVIKLKYGKSANELIIHDAPRGVKFALGENVKRSEGRFPNTRLGVEAVLIRAFTEAQNYELQWQAYRTALKAGNKIKPTEPRRDLRLEALVDVLNGKLKVHCHCYRADEILMLLRVADRFGFKVQSLQHVLEGYKIAKEIAEHGASNSTFSDWWAYKIEAYDATPYNAALLHKAGAMVCLKSDSTELMRHLYQEAAKVIKYGGMSHDEALKTITINGAKQLGLEKRIGSIEVGKDGDIAIFNGHPLHSFSRVEMTLVEGEVYFQRLDKLPVDKKVWKLPEVLHQNFKDIKRNPKGKYLLKGVTLHRVKGKTESGMDVLIEKGRITRIFGSMEQRDLADDVFQVDARGIHLYPGMIDAASVIGLTELGSAKETQDYNEIGDFQPDLRASTGINPDSAIIPVTRANGVTSVLTRPTGTVIAGQSAFINLAGWVPRDMTVVDPLALHIDFPSIFSGFRSNPSGPRLGRAVAKRQRTEKIRRLKLLFRQAKAYANAREASSDTAVNPRLEALVPYAKGDKPIIIQVSRKTEILEALKLADEMKWQIILNGAIDAWKVADELKKRNVPVILGPVMSMPRESYDPYDAPYACAEKLRQAGVKFCIRSGGGTNTRNLPYEAAMAVSYGLPVEEALKAVTLYPAQILGLEKEVGSIEVGKRANLVLTNGDILQTTTNVYGLFIDGKPIAPTSKHTRLYERYLQRLREIQERK